MLVEAAFDCDSNYVDLEGASEDPITWGGFRFGKDFRTAYSKSLLKGNNRDNNSANKILRARFYKSMIIDYSKRTFLSISDMID